MRRTAVGAHYLARATDARAGARRPAPRATASQAGAVRRVPGRVPLGLAKAVTTQYAEGAVRGWTAARAPRPTVASQSQNDKIRNIGAETGIGNTGTHKQFVSKIPSLNNTPLPTASTLSCVVCCRYALKAAKPMHVGCVALRRRSLAFHCGCAGAPVARSAGAVCTSRGPPRPTPLGRGCRRFLLRVLPLLLLCVEPL